MTELQEQMTIFEWAEYMKRTMPELLLLFHVPNGGKRDARTAAVMKLVDEGKVDHVESDYENNRFVIYSTSYDDDGRLYYVGFDVDPEMRKYFTENGVEY